MFIVRRLGVAGHVRLGRRSATASRTVLAGRRRLLRGPRSPTFVLSGWTYLKPGVDGRPQDGPVLDADGCPDQPGCGQHRLGKRQQRPRQRHVDRWVERRVDGQLLGRLDVGSHRGIGDRGHRQWWHQWFRLVQPPVEQLGVQRSRWFLGCFGSRQPDLQPDIGFDRRQRFGGVGDVELCHCDRLGGLGIHPCGRAGGDRQQRFWWILRRRRGVGGGSRALRQPHGRVWEHRRGHRLGARQRCRHRNQQRRSEQCRRWQLRHWQLRHRQHRSRRHHNSHRSPERRWRRLRCPVGIEHVGTHSRLARLGAFGGGVGNAAHRRGGLRAEVPAGAGHAPSSPRGRTLPPLQLAAPAIFRPWEA
jgi:hypothetical protein